MYKKVTISPVADTLEVTALAVHQHTTGILEMKLGPNEQLFINASMTRQAHVKAIETLKNPEAENKIPAKRVAVEVPDVPLPAKETGKKG